MLSGQFKEMFSSLEDDQLFDSLAAILSTIWLNVIFQSIKKVILFSFHQKLAR